MGIGIHKMLGYGLTNVKFENYRITDPRINMPDYEDGARDRTFSDLLIYMEQNNIDDCLLKVFVSVDKLLSGNLKLFDKCIIWESEYGEGSVLCLIPPSRSKSWYRYDNIIDYAEETYAPGREQHNYVTLLESAIYPFESYWDTRNGQRVDASDYCFCRRAEGHKDADILVKKLFNVSNYTEFRTVFAPKPPDELLAMCEFLQLMNKETTWQLQPMIYVYWG